MTNDELALVFAQWTVGRRLIRAVSSWMAPLMPRWRFQPLGSFDGASWLLVQNGLKKILLKKALLAGLIHRGVAMSLRSIRRRLELLEAAIGEKMQKSAIVVYYPGHGEKHLELVSAGGSQWQFIEQPGAGPQLKDFGEFDPVLFMSEFEARF